MSFVRSHFRRLGVASAVLVIGWSMGGLVLIAQEAAEGAGRGVGESKVAVSTKPALPELPVATAGVAQPMVMTGELDHHGQPVMVACATCHTTRAPNFKAGAETLPVEFHPGLKYAHGGLSCLSCHNSDNYDTLRRADGQALAYDQALALCAQCHGPQTRDYNHGSHGGMVGYWDREAGERRRNRCVDCHDVHAPAYPLVNPIFSPRDRGAREQLARAQEHAAEAAEHSNAETPAGHD